MRRVFVTGLGAVTPSGVGLDPLWDDLIAARARFQAIDRVYPAMEDGYFAGCIALRDRDQIISAACEAERVRPPDSSLYAMCAVSQALADAGLAPGDPRLANALVCIGNNEAEADLLDEHVEDRGNRWGDHVYSSHAIADHVAAAIGSYGPAFCVHNTCASANVACEFALRALRAGMASVALVGGADAFSHKVWSGFYSLNALGPEPCRPFARQRRFITISEGAAFLVLQADDAPPLVHRTPYAELAAATSNNDAKHPTNPDRGGVHACHEQLLKAAGLPADAVTAIMAHGTGTKANDAVEAEIFEQMHPQAAVTAIKGTTGHLMATAGAIGAVAACLTLERGALPPTNIDARDFEFDFDLVTGVPRTLQAPEFVQNNAFGFGGNNAITLFRAVA